MSSKILNREVVKRAVISQFWKSERNELFADSFHIDFPNAAPGIPQCMDEFEVAAFFHWLDETVESWECNLEDLYGTPDPNVFWAVSFIRAQVHWGGQDGLLETKRFGRYELKDGKIVFLSELTNPLKWLEAAGREIPIFHMDYNNDRVIAELEKNQNAPHNACMHLATDPDSVNTRIANNLAAFMNGDYWKSVATIATYQPGYDSKVWFLPPEMRESYPEEDMERVEMWSLLSCPYIEFDRRGRVWETDDPHVYFGEYRCIGITDWIGNNKPNSRYRNRYFYILHMNDAGEISGCEEILNPINKYNSINVSVPSFPYYF